MKRKKLIQLNFISSEIIIFMFTYVFTGTGTYSSVADGSELICRSGSESITPFRNQLILLGLGRIRIQVSKIFDPDPNYFT